MSSPRTEAELINVDDPAWPELAASIADAQLPVEVVPISDEQGRQVLYRLQVTARSTLGALALNCGGLLIDHGWLRVLGGGSQGLPDLAAVNKLDDPTQGPNSQGYMTVAYDVLGGQFAIDGGGLGIQPGQICYFAPDTLTWGGLGVGHGSFVDWVLTDGPTQFYEDMRWDGWQDEVKKLTQSQGIAVYPPLWSAEGHSTDAASKRAISFDELLASHQDSAAQLASSPDENASAAGTS